VNRQVQTRAEWTRDVGPKPVQPVAGEPAAADVSAVR
jgi:hypothetical protein